MSTLVHTIKWSSKLYLNQWKIQIRSSQPSFFFFFFFYNQESELYFPILRDIHALLPRPRFRRRQGFLILSSLESSNLRPLSQYDKKNLKLLLTQLPRRVRNHLFTIAIHFIQFDAFRQGINFFLKSGVLSITSLLHLS